MKKTLTLSGFILGLSLLFPVVSQAETILQDIQKNGVLRIGIRQDSAPFGYLDEKRNLRGLCVETAELLRESLETQLKRPVRIEKSISVLAQDSPQNRFTSVIEGKSHIECGPNTILRNPPEGITFSIPYLYSGTYFISNPESRLLANPSGFMQKVTIGVLSGSLTQKFIDSRYPLAQQKVYEGPAGRVRGVKDAIEGKIDVFAGEQMVLVGEALLLGYQPNQFSIIPKQPLTCVSYGLILPTKDPEWITTVNTFLQNQSSIDLIGRLYGKDSPFVSISVFDQDKCI